MTPESSETPARPDPAAGHPKGKREAGRQAEATTLAVSVALAPLTARPDAGAPLENQLLYGERFAVTENDGEWARGEAESDGYGGYVPSACLMPAGPAPTHRVSQPISHIYPAPVIKRRTIGWLSYGALVRVEGVEAGFAALSTGGFVPAPHLAPRQAPAADWVAEAERLLGAPYLWGGRGATGLDCSALVQLALAAAGRGCPRDSDRQEVELGRTLAPGAEPERGDLMFWRGHVGIMLDPTRLLHCGAHHMAVAIEPLETARARMLAAGKGPVTRHARLDAAAGDR